MQIDILTTNNNNNNGDIDDTESPTRIAQFLPCPPSSSPATAVMAAADENYHVNFNAKTIATSKNKEEEKEYNKNLQPAVCPRADDDQRAIVVEKKTTDDEFETQRTMGQTDVMGIGNEADDDDDDEDVVDVVTTKNPLLFAIEKSPTKSSFGDDVERQRRKKRDNAFFGKFRFCIALLLAMATFCYTSMRVNLSMAMVCMVNTTAVRIKEKGHFVPFDANLENVSSLSTFIDDYEDQRCPIQSSLKALDSKSTGYAGTLDWSTAQQARLFGATFYGSFFTVFISGYLSDRFGTKLLVGLAIADYSLVSLLSPLFVSLDYNVFFVARLFMGFGEGFAMPTLLSASARWFPPNERSLMIAICTLGNQIASVVALLVSSRLCALELFGGWPTIFYTFGFFGMLCVVLWSVFSSSNPEESRWIGNAEERMINTSLGQRRASMQLSGGPLPWRQIGLSLPLYAGILSQANYTFSNVILQSYLPTFFKEVVQLNLKNNGYFSIIPFFSIMISKVGFGIFADFLARRNILGPTKRVKFFQSIACFGNALAALLMGIFVSCQTPTLAAIFLILWGVSGGASTSGFLVQLISLAPRYSGIISSLATGMGILSSGFSPIVVSSVVKQGTSAEWRIIWYILAACNLFSGFFFLTFASAIEQKWANYSEGYEEKKPKLEKIVR